MAGSWLRELLTETRTGWLAQSGWPLHAPTSAFKTQNGHCSHATLLDFFPLSPCLFRIAARKEKDLSWVGSV